MRPLWFRGRPKVACDCHKQAVTIVAVAVSFGGLSASPATAACPTSISTPMIIARGATTAAVIYRIDATFASPLPSTATVIITTRSGAVTMTWKPDTGDSGEATFFFSRPSSDVENASITSVGDAKYRSIDCGGLTPITSPFADDAGVSVFDDTTQSAQFAGPWTTGAVFGSDASFAKIVYPAYPEMMREEGIEGAIEAMVAIGSDGKPTNSWVLARNTTSWTDGFDSAALAAIARSTFHPRTEYGRPVAGKYIVDYTFVLDSGGGSLGLDFNSFSHYNEGTGSFYSHYLSANPFPSRPAGNYAHSNITAGTSGCGLDIEDMDVEPAGPGDALAWYLLSFASNAADNAAASIGILTSDGHTSYIDWPNIHLTPIPFEDDAWRADATFPSFGPPILAAWVAKVTSSDGTSTKCTPYISEPLYPLTAPANPRVVTGVPASTTAIADATHPPFVDEVSPDYSPDLRAKKIGGEVEVEFIVDGSGKPVEVFVVRTSGDADLDQAAVEAAAKSTFVPTGSTSDSYYYTFYRFVPQSGQS